MKRLTNYHLKIIAIVTMVIDHTCKIFLPQIHTLLTTYFSEQTAYIIYLSIESLGRISFILFAFMIAQGCHYTHDIKKYIQRLLIFGIISEIPFQWMISVLSDQPFVPTIGFTNVFFTLALGAIAIAGYQIMKQVKYLPLFICCITAYLINCDYGIIGILFIFLFYRLENIRLQMILIIIITFLQYIIVYPYINGIDNNTMITIFFYFGYSLLSIPLIYSYNGERGKKMKLIFYAFYPIHILILCTLYQWI